MVNLKKHSKNKRLKLCPSSETRSKKFTAWIIQTIKVMLNDAIKKKFSISKENLRNINLFIEIIVLINIQHYLIKISKK